MQKIDRHIEILLLENDCIIVPGLGGFVAYYSEAKFIKTDNIYLPPYRTVGFNPVLIMNDSLLVQSYIEAYDLSYPEAMREIESEVNNIYKILEDFGTFELKGLGTLKRDGNDKISFEPYEGGLLTPKYYGFSCFDLNYLASSANIETDNSHIQEEKDKKPQVIYLDINNQGEKRLSISLRAVKDFAAAAVLLSIVFIVGFTAQKRNNHQGQEVKSGVFYNIFDSDNSKKNEPKSSEAQTSAKNKVHIISSAPYWSLVLASHVNESNAKSFIKKLHKNGFHDAFIYTKAGSIKVVYGKYKTAQIAADKLNNLRGNDNFEQAWILEIRK
ncbi:SPOR domain-containing protein [Prevotella aurantiaca]|jgi:sporulation and cell division repeat protein|uniref:HU-CCDC81 and SPOR domain-containing protein n=1 Tax=Prevotella aurantiaca TaxID=596085 RepID=A0A930MZ17_9BACT|nr:SPOR domain-containing protein [Prevotella aurantiaca]MBF1384175.1 HU-CCDC81 and SPOR domain-containing protein [Prevotella aurantiaca]MBF1385963.1 HU-CCDC81 and SPOR domain-containing protein [Prevotella aurantiaca]